MTTAQASLEAAGDRVGAKFRLGGCTGAWTRTRYRARVGCASTIVFTGILLGWIPVALIGGHDRLIAAEVLGGVLLVAFVLAGIPPRMWEYRLFRFEHGLVLVDPQQAAPTVLRWGELTSISMRILAGGNEDSIVSCELRDRSGQAVSLGGFGTAVDEIASAAEELLAQRLLPALIARYDAGASVFFGLLTVERWGLSAPASSSGMRWRTSWPEISHIDISEHGHRLAVKDATGPVRMIMPGAEPNDFLARCLIEHAARQAGVDVTRPA
jgi:hypothetical protein